MGWVLHQLSGKTNKLQKYSLAKASVILPGGTESDHMITQVLSFLGLVIAMYFSNDLKSV